MTEPRWERELQLLIHEILGWRTRPALASLRLLYDLYLPWLERRLVLRARRDGVSWTGIGRLLGRSRQAIQQRHHVPAHVTDGLAPVLPAWYDEQERTELFELLVQLRREREADATDEAGGLVPW